MEKYKVLISILSGIICFVLSPYGVESEWGNIVIDVPWVIVLPFIISIAYGWRYALIVSIAGGAIYPFYLWYNNGYACLSTSLVYTLSYLVLGMLNEKSFARLIGSYYIRIVAVFTAIMFIFFIFYTYLLNATLAINPPFWNSTAINSMSKEVIQSITIKNSINYLIILLLSTSLLKLPFVQKLLKLKTTEIAKDNTLIFFISILIGCVVWGFYFLLANSLIQNDGDSHKHYLTLAFYVIVFANLFVSRIIMEYSERNWHNLIAISENENLLSTVINTIPDLIWLKDNDGIYLKCNKRFELFFGASEKEIQGKTDYDFVSKELADRFRANDLKAYNASEPLKYEGEIEYKIDKHKEIIETIKAQLKINGKTVGILGIGRNITDRKKSEAELEMHRNHLEKMVESRTEELESTVQHLKEAQAQLIQAEKMASLGILTAGVAHEINNPLNYIMGSYVGLLRHFEDNSFAEHREQVGTLINALKIGVERSSAIVEGLNQFSRKSDSYSEDCELHAIIENSLAMLRNRIKHNIIVTKEFSDSDIVVKGNVGNLHQVFSNLLHNAIQSIVSKGVIIVKTKIENSVATVTIKDTGVGIPPENLEKITDPFFTTKGPGEGTGLGLSISYNIIKEHKGKLLFDSEVGKGTTVKIVLPYA